MAKERQGYERERVHLTAQTVARAMRMIDEGQVPGRGIEFADTAKDAAGLTLRVTRASATWYLRHRRGTIRLGGVDVLDLQAARIAAARARLDFAAGFDPSSTQGSSSGHSAKARPYRRRSSWLIR